MNDGNEFTSTLPATPGLYHHRWVDHTGTMREHLLFVGYVNPSFRRLQGTSPLLLGSWRLRCCPPCEPLHTDRLTPEEWGGWWARASEMGGRVSDDD